jgi:tetratricopeptide (TPR) repeat protein
MDRPRTPRSRRRTLALLLACAAFSLAGASPREARADQKSDLEKGRQLYKDGKHAECEGYFATALDGATPTLTEPELVEQARMIRGTCDLYLGRQADAIQQFERAVRLDPKFEPNPIDYPPGVLDEFHKTKQRVLAEPVTNPEAELRKELTATREDLIKLQAKYDALKIRYQDEEIIVRHSHLVAAIPFGVGQFQNGDDALGLVFAITEGLALGTATVSFIVHQAIPAKPADVDKAKTYEITSRIVNYVGVGSFVTLAIVGWVQAELAYQPMHVEHRKRALPKEASWQPIVGFDGRGFSVGIGGAF